MAIVNLEANFNFSFSAINSAYLEKLLLSLDEKKACGPDGITSNILRISKPAIVTPLTKLYNYCIVNSIWLLI